MISVEQYADLYLVQCGGGELLSHLYYLDNFVIVPGLLVQIGLRMRFGVTG